MSNSWELLRKRLNDLADKQRGFKADFARRLGIKPTAIQQYFSGQRTPGLEQLDKFAEALGAQPWELIKPEGAASTPALESPTIEALTRIVSEQENRIKALEVQLQKARKNLQKDEGSPAKALVKDKPVIADRLGRDARNELREFAENADYDAVIRTLKNIDAAGLRPRTNKAKRSTSDAS